MKNMINFLTHNSNICICESYILLREKQA